VTRQSRKVTMPHAVRVGKDGDYNVQWYATEQDAQDAHLLLDSIGGLEVPGRGRAVDLDAPSEWAVRS
jgi:hypothetical protein